MGMEDYSKHQQGIIKRYYSNSDTIQLQKLGEKVTELYLADGKKRDKLWASVEGILRKLEVPASRIEHVMNEKNVEMLARLVQELQGKK